MTEAKTMTAAEFVETISNPIVWYVSVAAPGGETVALLPGTELGFDLSEVEGVASDDDFVATNLTHGSGAHDWSFTDFSTSYVLNIKIYDDQDEWDKQMLDYLVGAGDGVTVEEAISFGVSEDYAKAMLTKED